MKNLLSLATGAITRVIPIIGIGSEIKEEIEKEIKAASICIFLLGFASCLTFMGISSLLFLGEKPGIGLGIIFISIFILVPSFMRLKKAKEKIDSLKPLIESAQKISKAAQGAIDVVANKADVAVSFARNLLGKMKN